MNKLKQMIFSTEPFELTITLPIEEARLRLDAKLTKLALFKFNNKQQVVGRLSGEDVKFWRGGHASKNSFNPIFYGTLKSNGNQTALSGGFSLHRSIQIALTIWFVMLALAFVVALFFAIIKPSEYWFAPLLPGILFIFGLGLVHFGKMVTAKDIPWLKHQLQTLQE